VKAIYLQALRKFIYAGHQWLMPVIQATQEAEIKKIAFQSQPEQIVNETLSGKYSSQCWWSGSR
jgi:hypothetical protein